MILANTVHGVGLVELLVRKYCVRATPSRTSLVAGSFDTTGFVGLYVDRQTLSLFRLSDEGYCDAIPGQMTSRCIKKLCKQRWQLKFSISNPLNIVYTYGSSPRSVPPQIMYNQLAPHTNDSSQCATRG